MPRYAGELLVVAVAALLLIPLGGLSPVFQVSEGREGVVVLEILRTGELILPLRHGTIIPSKPILFHWVGALCAWLSGGRYDELLLRLPSLLAAVGTVWIVFRLGRTLGGQRAGFISAGVLLSTYCFVHLARDGRVDMLFCFWSTAAIAIWIAHAAHAAAVEGKPSEIRSSVYYLAGLCAGAAILTKGPLGVVLPLLVIAAAGSWWWGRAAVRALVHPGWLLAAAIGVPWYLSATLRGKESFLLRQIVFENLHRFTGAKGISAKPFWFYAAEFWSTLAPWSLLFAVVLWSAGRRWFKGRPPLLSECGLKTQFGFSTAIVWVLSVLVFLSLASGKRRGYLLLVAPPIALSLGLLLSTIQRMLHERGATERLFTAKVYRVGFVLWLLPVLTSVVAVAAVFSGWTPGGCAASALHASALTAALARSPFLIALNFAALSGAALLLWRSAFRRQSLLLAEIAAFLLLQLIFVVIVNVAVTTKGMTHTYRQVATEVLRRVPADEPLFFVKKLRDESFDGLFFYLQRRVLLVKPDEQPTERGWYLMRKKRQPAFEARLGEQVTPIYQGGRWKDIPEDQLVLVRVE